MSLGDQPPDMNVVVLALVLTLVVIMAVLFLTDSFFTVMFRAMAIARPYN